MHKRATQIAEGPWRAAVLVVKHPVRSVATIAMIYGISKGYGFVTNLNATVRSYNPVSRSVAATVVTGNSWADPLYVDTSPARPNSGDVGRHPTTQPALALEIEQKLDNASGDNN